MAPYRQGLILISHVLGIHNVSNHSSSILSCSCSYVVLANQIRTLYARLGTNTNGWTLYGIVEKIKTGQQCHCFGGPNIIFFGGGNEGHDIFRVARPSNKVIGSDHFVQENAHFRFVTASYFMSRLSDSVFADMPTSYSIEVVGLLLT